jgi:hypothetical protein
MITDFNLWAAQDALLDALNDQPALQPEDITVELGFPASIQPDHVWIGGESSGAMSWELSGTKPSAEMFRLSVFVYTQRAEPYPDVRSRLRTFAAAVEDALESDKFAAVVPAWGVPEYKLDAGTDGTHRQLCLEIVVGCRCW